MSDARTDLLALKARVDALKPSRPSGTYVVSPGETALELREVVNVLSALLAALIAQEQDDGR